MPRVYVDFSVIQQAEEEFRAIRSQIERIESDFSAAVRALDWEVRYSDDVKRTSRIITSDLDTYKTSLGICRTFLSEAHRTYMGLSEYDTNPAKSALSMTLKNGAHTQCPALGAPIYDVRRFVSVLGGLDTGIPLLKKGLPYLENSENDGSYSDTILTVPVTCKKDDDGTTCWRGKTTSGISNERGSIEHNLYAGKIKTKKEFSINLWNKEYKAETEDGKLKFDRDEDLQGINAGVGFEGNIFSGDTEITAGDDLWGSNPNAGFSFGKVKAGTEMNLSRGEDGANAYLSGSAIASVLDLKFDSTVNILGVEITPEVTGHIGAVGMEGKIGFENGDFVAKVGAAPGIGLTAGVKVQFNDSGKDAIWDMLGFGD